MSDYQYPQLKVESPNVKYSVDEQGNKLIESLYEYEHVRVERQAQNSIKATPMKTQMTFKTQLNVPKVGVMLVGLGGNNGTTVVAATLANKHQMSFETKDGLVKANYFGSVTQSSTVYIGNSAHGDDEEYFMPMKDIIPMMNPNEIPIDGWDISSLNLGEAMKRAKVLDVSLQKQLYPMMSEMKPRRALFDLNFVAENQDQRADNILDNSKLTKWEQVQIIMQDIQDFKTKKQLDKVIILWTANTERFTELIPGVHDTSANLLKNLKDNTKECSEISPSTLYALASILSGCTYINGSPQNTFVPGLIELAEEKGVFIGGDDFKSGQTKFKSVLVDFLVNAGIKPCSIVSYNHLGNNDGYNLSAPKQFRSKEISKSSVVDDMVKSNQILYGKQDSLHKPDHCVVIKYVPYVADSKRALDEYVSELMLGGKNTIVSHNTCEDSLLAAPLIIDLILLAELCERIQFKLHKPEAEGLATTEYQKFNAVLSVLSYLCKAPLVERGAKVVNALFKQRSCIENLLRALISLPPINHMDFQYKLSRRQDWTEQVNKVEIVESKKEVAKMEAINLKAMTLEQPQPQQQQQQQHNECLIRKHVDSPAKEVVPKSASGY